MAHKPRAVHARDYGLPVRTVAGAKRLADEKLADSRYRDWVELDRLRDGPRAGADARGSTDARGA